LVLSGRELSEETKSKLSVAATEHGGTNYRERALAFYGEQCQRCGFEPVLLEDLIVHHKNMLHAGSSIGDHRIENLAVLCRKCHMAEHRDESGRLRGLDKFEKGILYVLDGMRRDFGIDVADANFRDTPKRFARALSEILAGANDTQAQVDEIVATRFESGDFDQMLVAQKIQAVSLCPHHLLPVQYEVSVGYLPGDGKVLGLSKLVRLANVLAARPVLQETMTVDIAKVLMERVGARGAGVFVRGRHACMWARGVKNDSVVVTSALKGDFDKNADTRQEFLSMAGAYK
jgi:GTP cyclohydrolase I